MNGIASSRQALAYLGNLGSALPAAIAQHRGNFYWKRASGAEDELYAGVKDASGVNQLRRILTETYADTLYQPIGDTSVTAVVRQIVPNPNASTWQTSLTGAPTITAASTANTDDATGGSIRLTTTNSTGNAASLVAGAGGGTRGDWSWELEGLIARLSGQTINFRIWFGLFEDHPSSSSDPSGFSGAGFLLSTDVSISRRGATTAHPQAPSLIPGWQQRQERCSDGGCVRTKRTSFSSSMTCWWRRIRPTTQPPRRISPSARIAPRFPT
jgi:hypothetical protein